MLNLYCKKNIQIIFRKFLTPIANFDSANISCKNIDTIAFLYLIKSYIISLLIY